jgi:hypothetical protein
MTILPSSLRSRYFSEHFFPRLPQHVSLHTECFSHTRLCFIAVSLSFDVPSLVQKLKGFTNLKRKLLTQGQHSQWLWKKRHSSRWLTEAFSAVRTAEV